MSSTFLVDFPAVGLHVKSILATITSDTTTNGTSLDCANSEGPVTALIYTGNAGDASTAFVVKLQESTDDSTFTDITGASATFAASATANDNLATSFKTDKRSKRYVRAAVVTSGGGTPSVPITVAVVTRKKIVGSGTGTYVGF